MGWIDAKAGLAMLTLGLLCHCGGGNSAQDTAGVGPPAAGLAVYVYTDLATDLTARQRFFAFAQSRNVRRIFFQSASFIGASSAALGDFVADASGHGMAVSLLFGQSDWALSANQPEALQRASQSLTFLAGLQAGGQPTPDAIQFDVEPYVLPEWTTDLQGTANQYLDLLASLRAQLNGQLPLVVTIPFWLDGQPVTRAGQTRPMSEWIIDSVDGLVMLDYRNQAQAILSGASSELAYASTQAKPMTLALDVQCGSDDTITFCPLGQALLYQAMATVDASARAEASYEGLGVFDYEDWLLLQP